LVPNRPGLVRALGAGAQRVVVTIGVTDTFNRRNVNRPVADSLSGLGPLVAEAAGAGAQVDVSLSCAFGCPFEGRVRPARVAEVARACVDAGVDEVGVADTIGVATPPAVERVVEAMAGLRLVPHRLALHLHDTRGLGLANAMAAAASGIRRFEGSLGGIGGCPFTPRATGNVCSEDLLHLLSSCGYVVAADLDRYVRAATRLAERLGTDLPGRLHRAGLWEGRPLAGEGGATGSFEAGDHRPRGPERGRGGRSRTVR
jgi:isopropylmalate/homocitrate/citramalate synthase